MNDQVELSPNIKYSSELLGLAGELMKARFDGLGDDVLHRAAISHAYYSTFHALSNLVDECGIEEPAESRNRGTHELIIFRCEQLPRSIKSLSDKSSKKLVRLVRILKERRVVADYKPEIPVAATLALSSVDLARAITTTADKFREIARSEAA